MRKISISINKFISSYLAVHLRKALRLKFLNTMLSVFDVINTEYVAWRDEAVIKAKVTGETMSLEWYLNYMCGSGTAITIETAGLTGVTAGIISSEPSLYLVAGIQSSEPTKYKSAGFKGEDTIWGTKTFIVKVPTAYSAYSDTIISIVNSFRAAGKSFKIVLY